MEDGGVRQKWCH